MSSSVEYLIVSDYLDPEMEAESKAELECNCKVSLVHLHEDMIINVFKTNCNPLTITTIRMTYSPDKLYYLF